MRYGQTIGAAFLGLFLLSSCGKPPAPPPPVAAVPTTPANPFIAIADSLAKSPPPADQKWSFGPQDVMTDDEIRHAGYPPSERDELLAMAPVYRGRLVCLAVTRPGDHPSFSEIYDIWLKRMLPILESSEIVAAGRALNDVHANPAWMVGKEAVASETSDQFQTLVIFDGKMFTIDVWSPNSGDVQASWKEYQAQRGGDTAQTLRQTPPSSSSIFFRQERRR